MPSPIVIFDIDGIIRDVGGSYRRALADTVEQFTQGAYRPDQTEIDALKSEGCWNNDWEASQELVYRHFEAQGQPRSITNINYETLVAFFQSRYRGPDPLHWTGYICDEPLLVNADYFALLTAAGISWGFFSGATRGSATYVLEKRLKLSAPVLVAMEDAPGKPDPTGLLIAVQRLQAALPQRLVVYVGDTVADMQTVLRARQIEPTRSWVAVGVLPPHAQQPAAYAAAYQQTLAQAGANVVLGRTTQLTAEVLQHLSDRATAQ